MDPRGNVQEMLEPASGIAEFLGAAGPEVYGLVPQPCLDPIVSRFLPGRRATVSLSYSYFARPDDPRHPDNVVELTAEQTAALEALEDSDLPDWLKERMGRIRYPALWDCVHTTTTAPGDVGQQLDALLRAHLGANVRPAVGRSEPEPPEHTARAFSVLVDGRSLGAIRVQNQDAVAVGFVSRRRIVTAVVPHRFLSSVRLDFSEILD